MMADRLDKISETSAKLSVEVSADKVNSHLNSFYGALAKQVNIKGYRKGKAPLAVVKKMYAKEASGEISQQLISEGLRDAVKKHDLKIILPPRLTAVDDPQEGHPFTFEAELDLKPSIPEINLEGIAIEVSKEKAVTDEVIQEEADRILDQFAEFEDVALVRPIQKGDRVIVKYDGFLNGEKLEEASAPEQPLDVGSEGVTPEFEKAVLGLQKGETRDFEVNFPDGHNVESVRGQKILFKLEVLNVQAKKLPEWNEGLVKKVDESLSTFDELKAKLKENLEEQYKHQSRKERHEAIQEELLKKYPLTVSERQKELSTQSLMQETVERLLRMGQPQAEIEKRKEEIQKSAAQNAVRQIQLSYLLEAIGQQNDLKVTEDDIVERLEQTAKVTGLDVERVRHYYNQKEEDQSLSRMDRLRLDVLDEKSLDYALSKATIKEKD